jgi:polar amino acid transport system permease protein
MNGSLRDSLDEALPLLLSGAKTTAEVTVLAAVVAFVVSFPAGMAQLHHSRWVRWPVTAYIEVFRGSSALVLLFLFYYVLPLVDINLPPFQVAVIVLGLSFGAYCSQIVRGAMVAIDHGQHDAGAVLGFSRWQTFRIIVLPQAWPIMIPPFGNEVIEILKASALVSLIGLADLTWSAKSAADSQGDMTTVYVTALLMYLVLSLPIIALFHVVERKATRFRFGVTRPERGRAVLKAMVPR